MRPSRGQGLASVLYFCFLSFFAQSALAVFQDEAYSLDYAHSLVGTPIRHNTFFHAPDTGSKATLLYTLSEQGVIGAINPRDGELVWRTLANDTVSTRSKDQSLGVLRAYEKSTTIVSGIGNHVRAWDAKDGRLVWQWSKGTAVKSIELLTLDNASGDIVVLTEGETSGGMIWRLSGTDGSEKWSTHLADTDYPIGASVSATQIFSTSLSPAKKGGYKLQVQTIDPASGKELSHQTLDTENDVSSEGDIVHLSSTSSAPIVVWKEGNFKTLKFNVLGHKQTSMAILDPYGAGMIKSVLIHEASGVDLSPRFLLQLNSEQTHRAEVWNVDVKAGKVNRAFAIQQKNGAGAFSTTSDGKEVVFIHHTASEITLIESAAGKALETLEAWPSTNANAQHFNRAVKFAISESAPRTGSSFALRNVYVNVEGDLAMVQNAVHAWTRYEGLAGVVAAAFVDIPAEESLVKAFAAETDANPLAAYLHRVQRHVVDLQHFPKWAANVPARLISSFTGLRIGEDAHPLGNDGFGFNKIVIVATKSGRVAALSSGAHGKLLWSVLAAEYKDNQPWRVKSIDVTAAGVHVIGLGGELIIVDATTGKIIQQQWAQPDSGTSHLANVATTDGRPVHVAISDKGVPGSLPDSVATDAVIVTERLDGTIAGWKQTAPGKTTLAWYFQPRQGETINSLTVRAPHDPVASIGRALGDRNVLYKYLSSNLILVTATSLAASTLSVYLLDSITGQTLYSTSHHNVDVSQEVPVTFSENWFAYGLFSDVAGETPAGSASSDSAVKAHQLIVSEMFESQIPNDRGPLGQAMNFSTVSDLYAPDVKSAAFVVPAPITALSTTTTLQGITPRSLLAYTPALAGLLAIPVPFLSPRRPVDRDPTAAEREEGLPRYQPHLDFAPTWFLSHKRELLGIEEIITSPSHMESTSLVFAHGELDVFGTRVSPIGAFDVLGKGFGKIQLVLTCVALAVGTGLLSPMARKKQIDGLWRS